MQERGEGLLQSGESSKNKVQRLRCHSRVPLEPWAAVRGAPIRSSPDLSIMCFRLAAGLRSASPQFGLTSPLIGFSSLPPRLGSHIQILSPPSPKDLASVAADSSALSRVDPEKYGISQTSEMAAYSSRLPVSLPHNPEPPPSPPFCALNINTFHT